MVGLAFPLIFIVLLLVISVFFVVFLSRGNMNLLHSRWSKILTFIGFLMLPFSYDIGSSIYYNFTFNKICENGIGYLKRVDGKAKSFKVEPGLYLELFSKGIEFVEWHVLDDYDRPKNYSPNLPAGYYKVFLRPLGDKDCELIKVAYPNSKYKLQRHLLHGMDVETQCLAIVKVDGPVAQYQYGSLSYRMETPYGYYVHATDTFVIDLFKNEKVGLLRGVSLTWKLPMLDFIAHMTGMGGGYSRGCRPFVPGSKGIKWQNFFKNQGAVPDKV